MKISAVIPAYNSALFIQDAISSIKKQSRTVDEIIVIDDGSMDNTEEIISNLNDPNIRYFKQLNQGPSAARNFGIQKAKGDWIAFLDADDQWTPDKIDLQLKTLDRSPSLKLIAGDMTEIDTNDHIITASVLAKNSQRDFFKNLNGQPLINALSSLLNKNFIPTGTVLVHR
ncbi:glycosyltransferase family 2 protein, partial [Methylicorpusculum sp.]